MSDQNAGNLADEALVSLYLESQSSLYFDELYRRYAAKIFGKCISLLRNEAAAADATQDIFMKLLLNLSRFSGQSKFSTWVYSITYNFCIDVIRKQKKRQMQSSAPEDLPDEEVQEISDAELLEIKVNRLKMVLDEMNPNDKVILLMKYQDGMTIADIAEGMALTESAVKMRIKRSKHKCKAIYDKLFKTRSDEE